MKRIFLYISMFIAGASFNSCSDLLDTETLSTDNLNYLCSNATDARKTLDSQGELVEAEGWLRYRG